MTPDELEKLLAEATPAPWEWHGTICCPDRGWVTTQEIGHKQPTHAFSVSDAEMIATLRNLTSALLWLWRAAERISAGHTNGTCNKLDEALRELENHR